MGGQHLDMKREEVLGKDEITEIEVFPLIEENHKE